MSETLKRILTAAPTFERDVPFSFSNPANAGPPLETTSIIAPDLEGRGGGTFTTPLPPQAPLPPITGTRTLQARGAPHVLSFLADFATALGAGVPAAQQQQAARREGIQSLLNEEARRAALNVQQQQQRFENSLRVGSAQRQAEELDVAKGGLALRQREFDLDVRKFNEALRKAKDGLGVDLNQPNEIAAASVLHGMAVDIGNPQAVRAALAKPGTLESIGTAIRKVSPRGEPTGALSERLAEAFVDRKTDPVGFAKKVLAIESQLRTISRDKTGDEIASRAALNAEASILQNERTQLNVELRGIENNLIQGFVRPAEKPKAEAQASALRKRVSEINERLQELVGEFRSLAKQSKKSLLAKPSAHQVGETVMFQGREHKVVGVNPDGSLQLSPSR